MEVMSIAKFVEYGTAPILIALMILNVWAIVKLDVLSKRFDRLEENVVWNDVFVGIKERVERLERITNGNGKQATLN